MSRRAASTRRGLALLEVVAATALLGLVSVGVVGSATYAVKADARRRQTIGANELANRLLVVALDDERNLPNPQAVYNDGEFDYRWELSKLPMTIGVPDNGVLVPATQGPASAVVTHAKFLIVRVWATRQSALGTAEVGGPLLAEVRRVVSPIGFMNRNPDAWGRISEDKALLMRLIAELAGVPGYGAGEGCTLIYVEPASSRQRGGGGPGR